MDPIERRTVERMQVELQATIVADARRPALEAVVRDISAGGARLEGADVGAVPKDFDLTITHASGETEVRHAQLVWQSEGAVGVRFSDYIGA
jgi:hypothetical protein